MKRTLVLFSIAVLGAVLFSLQSNNAYSSGGDTAASSSAWWMAAGSL